MTKLTPPYIKEFECDGCGKMTRDDQLYDCISCGGEFCKNCMADIRFDMVCKECKQYTSKYDKYLKEEW
jgi:hypothetical protein